MKEKYLVIASFVQYEQKTTTIPSEIFDTAFEALSFAKKNEEELEDYQAERSYQFYEVCVWSTIDSYKMYAKDKIAMEMLAQKELEALLAKPVPPAEIPPIV
jgi:hypothetical protein